MTCRITEFPTHVIRENTALRIHVITLAVNVSLVLSKFMSKKEHVRWTVLFIVLKMCCPHGNFAG